MPPRSSYKDALAWLYGTQRFGIKLGLENIQRLLCELDVPGKGQRAVHVAGTNGKGSVCAMIDAICREAGYRTGLFTSPHLVTYRERIQVDGEMIAEENVAEGLTLIRKLVRDWEPHPTFFEITTALALAHFKQGACGVIVLETGLGGRLDATNSVSPVVSVLTPIGYDHQSWLGNSLEEIAGEKAGIIKPRIPVVSAAQEPAAEKVIRERAAERQTPLQIVSQPYAKTPVALPGAHQKQNASLAIAALRAGGIAVDDGAIARGLQNVRWPARFQRWDERTIIDGAHNPAGAEVLAKTWRDEFGDERATIILAVLHDKDVAGICRALAPISDHVVLPRIRSQRSAEPEAIGQIFSSITPSLQHSITPSLADAFELARAKPNPILLTGSLHFAGEALATLRGEPAAFEECAQ
ncbi:MAG TPA: folylpolyglutamate synthase/dihydrofolate synthase family protein [Chthoniobacterales bacterium]|nr:folylpolyglutamate synthase/dihydrofolate synthase family protein [Chthoniobacterales bacterium]